MAFTVHEFDHLAAFNSAASSELLSKYDKYADEKSLEEAMSKPHKTFAPSSFRCDRRSWFRLRGVDPDEVSVPDRVLDFSAYIGTACHRLIQSNLKELLGTDWVNVSDYLRGEYCSVPDFNYTCEIEDNGLETLVEISDPPVRFACDGIIRNNDKLYLLEIKSSEFNSWRDLTDPKPQHIDQVECYCTLLGLSDVLFIYIDRMYGGMKCYEYSVVDYKKRDILSRFRKVQEAVRTNLAPDPLPKGDMWCNANWCPYYKKCGEYGR